jgi:hypothetical protein
MACRLFLAAAAALLAVVPSVAGDRDPDLGLPEVDPPRSAGPEGHGSAVTLDRPAGSFRELPDLSASLLYRIPAVASSPLIDPATGSLLFWRVASSVSPDREKGHDQESHAVRLYVARVEEMEGKRVAHLGPEVGATLCLGRLPTGATHPECEEHFEGEAIVETADDADPVAVAVTSTPIEPGDYLLVADRAGIADRFMEICWPMGGLPLTLAGDRVLVGVPFTVLEDGLFFLNRYVQDATYIEAAGFPTVQYVKVSLDRNDEVVSASVTYRDGALEPIAVGFDLHRARSRPLHENEYLGVFVTLAEPRPDRDRARILTPINPPVAERIRTLPLLSHPWATTNGNYQLFLDDP